MASHLLSNFVNFGVQKIEVLIKVPCVKHAFPRHTMGHLSLQLHHQLQHLVVAFSSKKNLSGVQFINGAPQRPHINGCIILATYN